MLSFEKDMYSDFVAKTFQYLELVQCKSCSGIFSINISKNKETKTVNLKVRCPGCKITSFEGRPYEYFSLNMIETAFLEGITYNHIKDSVLNVFSLYFLFLHKQYCTQPPYRSHIGSLVSKNPVLKSSGCLFLLNAL